MFKTVAVAAAAAVSIPAGAAIWKRRRLATGAERTSKALVNAAQARRPVDLDHETGSATDASADDHGSMERGVTSSTVRAVDEPVRMADHHTVA